MFFRVDLRCNCDAAHWLIREEPLGKESFTEFSAKEEALDQGSFPRFSLLNRSLYNRVAPSISITPVFRTITHRQRPDTIRTPHGFRFNRQEHEPDAGANKSFSNRAFIVKPFAQELINSN